MLCISVDEGYVLILAESFAWALQGQKDENFHSPSYSWDGACFHT